METGIISRSGSGSVKLRMSPLLVDVITHITPSE